MITPPWWPIYFGFCGKIEILYKIVHFVFFPGFTAFLAQIVYFSCMLTWILWQVRAFMNIPPLLTHIFWVSHKILSICANFRYFLLFMRVFFNVRTHRTWFTTLFILCHIFNNATQFSHLALKDCVYPDIQSFSPSGIPTLRGTLLAVNQHFVITAFTTSRNIMMNITRKYSTYISANKAFITSHLNLVSQRGWNLVRIRIH